MPRAPYEPPKLEELDPRVARGIRWIRSQVADPIEQQVCLELLAHVFELDGRIVEAAFRLTP